MATHPLTACFWIDAGDTVGGGHAVRAQALAQAFATRGITSRIFAEDSCAANAANANAVNANAANADAANAANANAANADAANANAAGPVVVESLDDSSFVDHCRAMGADLAVVDLPHTKPPSAALLRMIRQTGARLISFDASDPTASESDIFVHMVALSAELPNARREGHQLLGPDYLVLRAGLAEAARRRSATPANATRLVIGFGASDAAGLTTQVLTALTPYADALDIAVLLGPLASAETVVSVGEAAAQLRCCRVLRGVTDPTDTLVHAQIGLFGFGLLWLEAAAVGLPAVLWHASPAHAKVCRRFQRHLPGPVAVDLGDPSCTSSEKVADEVARLAQDSSRREAFSIAASRAVDGRGAQRVAAVAAQLVAS